MVATDPAITRLRDKVKAAQEEFDLAVIFYEVWKPAAYDTELHARMGTSYATQAFRVVSTALRREMIMALMRVWDKTSGTVQMEEIGREIAKPAVMGALAAERAARMGIVGAEDAIRSTMDEEAIRVAQIVGKYAQGGPRHSVVEKLRHLRHKRLAHRQVARVPVTSPSVTDEQIEEFYQDNSALIQALLRLVSGMGYDPSDAAKVFRHYAGHFWASVQGERMEGHPHYRMPASPRGRGQGG
jgi:hypothetical protein